MHKAALASNDIRPDLNVEQCANKKNPDREDRQEQMRIIPTQKYTKDHDQTFTRPARHPMSVTHMQTVRKAVAHSVLFFLLTRHYFIH